MLTCKSYDKTPAEFLGPAFIVGKKYKEIKGTFGPMVEDEHGRRHFLGSSKMTAHFSAGLKVYWTKFE